MSQTKTQLVSSPLNLNGADLTFPSSQGSTGQYLRNSSTAGTLEFANGGKILQVKQTAKTDNFTTTSTTFTDITGLSVSITPSNSSNKIMVFGDLAVGAASGQYIMLQLVRGSTEIYKGTDSKTYVASKVVYLNDNTQLSNASLMFLDSPATTSSVTYKIQIKLTGATTGAINRRVAVDDTSLASSITVMEVEA